MKRGLYRSAVGSLWAVLSGPLLAATPAELDRLGAAYCQSIGQIVLVAAAARDAGVAEAAQFRALRPLDPNIDRLTALAIVRVYRDRRPGPAIAEEVIGQCEAVLPHRPSP